MRGTRGRCPCAGDAAREPQVRPQVRARARQVLASECEGGEAVRSELGSSACRQSCRRSCRRQRLLCQARSCRRPTDTGKLRPVMSRVFPSALLFCLKLPCPTSTGLLWYRGGFAITGGIRFYFI